MKASAGLLFPFSFSGKTIANAKQQKCGQTITRLHLRHLNGKVCNTALKSPPKYCATSVKLEESV